MFGSEGRMLRDRGVGGAFVVRELRIVQNAVV